MTAKRFKCPIHGVTELTQITRGELIIPACAKCYPSQSQKPGRSLHDDLLAVMQVHGALFSGDYDDAFIIAGNTVLSCHELNVELAAEV